MDTLAQDPVAVLSAAMPGRPGDGDFLVSYMHRHLRKLAAAYSLPDELSMSVIEDDLAERVALMREHSDAMTVDPAIERLRGQLSVAIVAQSTAAALARRQRAPWAGAPGFLIGGG